MSDSANGRTHEPSLRELTADLDGVEAVLAEKIEGLKETMKNNDRRYEERFKAMDEKTSLALTASKEAVGKAETATEKRFDSVNEFRKTLSDQTGTFPTRDEVNAQIKVFDARLVAMKESTDASINSLKESRSEGIGKSATWAIVLGIVVILAEGLFVVIAHFWK